ncbi:guanylate kinase [Marinoscillum sp.]|uniref:guanylate kinase n=1 Tax=Marinoscillum sp. TaxID=2024838 RepID=UPI003BACB02A
MSQGKAVIFCAPSGAGKTTIVKELVQRIPELRFSISATTRSPREGEVNGQDYYFLTLDQFSQKRSDEELFEWQEVYQGTFYGTLTSEVERIWQSGNHVIFDIDVVGGVNLKKKLGNRALAIFVNAESVEVLKERLTKRNTETPASLAKRMGKAVQEMAYEPNFDYTLINRVLEDAVDEAERIVKEFLK